ncbi:hypothetical protein CZ771_09200 [Actinomycetales bacterium JB111]|nr:hypothetical protein CZ771_09200 [Actinomycetales bacterium JB111]
MSGVTGRAGVCARNAHARVTPSSGATVRTPIEAAMKRDCKI